MFVTGRIAQLVFLIVSLSVIYVIIKMIEVRKTGIPRIRKIPGLDVIDEAVKRCVEMGKPVFGIPGVNTLTEEAAPQTLAGMSVMKHVCKLAARYGAEFVMFVASPDVLALAEDTIKTALIEEKCPEKYSPSMINYALGWESTAFGVNYMEQAFKMKPGAVIFCGGIGAEGLRVFETGHRVGAFQIIGTATTSTIPFAVAVADYTLIGEEIYAAGAYLDPDPNQIGGIISQDAIKYIMIALLVLGAILSTMGLGVISSLLKI